MAERPRRIKLIMTIIMVVAVSMVSMSCGGASPGTTGDEAGSDIKGELREGDEAPDFSVELLTGETFRLSDHRGKVVFLNFWATWCPPCIAEMPGIQELSRQYEGEVVFIGVDLSEETEKVAEFVERGGYTFNIGLDRDGSIGRELYPSGFIPYTLIIDGSGIITKILVGGQTQDEFEKAITEALPD